MTLVVVGVALAVIVVVPVTMDRWAVRRASSTSLVSLALITLVGLLAVPLALAACLALQHPYDDAPAVRVGLVGAALVVAAMTGGRTVMTWRQVARRWQEIGAAVDASAIGRVGQVAVVPLRQRTAFVAGPTAAVSTGLLESLSTEQRSAVVAHEAAHAELGHPRLCAAAFALSCGVFRVAPARRAERRLRHELEALADAHAVRSLGDPGPLAAALAAVGGVAPEPGILGLGCEAVEDRIERLRHPIDPSPVADGAVLAATLAAALAAFVSVCIAVHVGWLGGGACLGIAALYLWVAQPRMLTRHWHRQGSP